MYSWLKRKVPGPNSGDMAFMPFTALPRYSVTGPGISQHRQLMTQQPQQALQLHDLILTSLDGITAGQFSPQPLFQGDEQGNI